MRIVDLGGSVHFWVESGLIDQVGHVVIYNISTNEVYTSSVSHSNIEVRLYGGKILPEVDGAYDLIVCNSVIEHIPSVERMLIAEEMKRVARHGFVQTPAWEFPIEPHFILPFMHWLPRSLAKLLVAVSPWALLSRPSEKTRQSYFGDTKLLSYRDVATIFPKLKIQAERFMGWPKSWVVTW